MTTINKNNVLFGGEVNFILSDSLSCGKYLLERIGKGGTKETLIDTSSGEKVFKCSDIIKNAIQTFHVLQKLGVKYGDNISICCENRPEYFFVLLSSLCLGNVVVPINFGYTSDELVHCFDVTKPNLVFCSSKTVKSICSLAQDRCKYIEKIVSFDTVTELLPAVRPVLEFTKLLQSIEDREDRIESFNFPKFNNRDSLALILYSSGTTGLPKGVMLTHYNVLYNYEIYRTSRTNLVDSDVMVSFLPLFHAYGCVGSLYALSINIKIVLLSQFTLETYLQMIEKYRGTICFTVPPICLLLAKSPVVDKYDLSSIRFVSCGAAPLRKSLAEEVSKRLKVPTVSQGYGMTETTLGVIGWTPDFIEKPEKYDSIGVLMPGIYAKVIDVDTGKALGPYEEGEFCFKGDIIMKGYYGNKMATNATIDSDNWLHTGDIGYYDSDLCFYVVDRLKELIKVKGFQVAPAEIESVLLQHKLIIDAGVVGIPDDKYGEIPLAFVVRESSKLTEKDVFNFVKERLSVHKHLKGGVVFINEIPKSPSGKILRRKLRELTQGHKSKL